VGLQDRRELGGVEDLVGVGVADAAEDARVGEGSLEGAVFGGEGGAEFVEGGGEDVDPSRVDVLKRGFVGEEVERSAVFGTGFGEDEGAVGEVESGEIVSATEFGFGGAPVETARDHEVQDEPEAVVELDGDALADATEGYDGVAFDLFDVGLNGAEQEWARDADADEGLVEDAELKGGEVGRDVGEFRHVVGEMITAACRLACDRASDDALHLRNQILIFRFNRAR
jgi:hypothetical protein